MGTLLVSGRLWVRPLPNSRAARAAAVDKDDFTLVSGGGFTSAASAFNTEPPAKKRTDFIVYMSQ